jgi:hypothetical protein
MKSIFTLTLAGAALTLTVSGAMAQSEAKPVAPAAPAVQSSSKERVTISPFTDKQETVEERMARFGTDEDPGPTPDPNRKWIRFGNVGKNYIIEKFPIKGAAFDRRKGWVRPIAYVNIPREIYQQDAEFVWVWSPLIDPNAPAKPTKRQTEQRIYTEEELRYVRQVTAELNELPVKRSDKTLTFREASEGLPQEGSWRNSAAVADMNEDGKLDLIIPPARGSVNGVPLIFLGDGAGKWTLWQEPSFPLATNYGSVAAADLNGDGHMDLVFGIHLLGVQAVLGNGKGFFQDASKGLPARDYPTRRAIIADLNKDGKPDIAAISEGPGLADRDNPRPIARPRIRAFINDGKANWKEQPITDALRELGGDFLVAGDFDGNGWTDLAGSSNVYGGTDTIWLNNGKKWSPFGRGWLPFYSYYGALTAGKFTNNKRDDLIVAFNRYYRNLPGSGIAEPPLKEVAGLDRISWEKKGPVRTPIVRWPSHAGTWGVASADFDGDGNLDVAYARAEPREFIFLLGDGKGGFAQSRVEGIEAEDLVVYDLKVTDINGDKRPDVLIMYEKSEGGAPGSVHVYLNETPQKKGVK